VLAVRLPRVRSTIENWAKQQKDRPSRSEAIRRLIEIALTAKSNQQSSRREVDDRHARITKRTQFSSGNAEPP
jgi:metal-responsive CopG/Arc/MetJ family transcriptional regulator